MFQVKIIHLHTGCSNMNILPYFPYYHCFSLSSFHIPCLSELRTTHPVALPTTVTAIYLSLASIQSLSLTLPAIQYEMSPDYHKLLPGLLYFPNSLSCL